MDIGRNKIIALSIGIVLIVIGILVISPFGNNKKAKLNDEGYNKVLSDEECLMIIRDFEKANEVEVKNSYVKTYDNIIITEDANVSKALIENDISKLNSFKEGDIIYSSDAGGFFKIIEDEKGSKSIEVPLAKEVFNEINIDLDYDLKPEDISIDGAIIESSEISFNDTNLFASVGNVNFSGVKQTITEKLDYYSPNGKFHGKLIKVVSGNKLSEIRVQGEMEVYSFDDEGDKNGSFSQKVDFSLFNLKYKYQLLKQQSIDWLDDPDILLEYHLDYDYENRIEMSTDGNVDVKLLIPFRINPNGTVSISDKGVGTIPSIIIKPQAGFNGGITVNGKVSSNQSGHALIEFFALTGGFNKENIKNEFYKTGKTNVIDTKAVSIFYNVEVNPIVNYVHTNVNISLNSIFGIGVDNTLMFDNTKLMEFSVYGGEKIEGEASGSLVWNLLEAPQKSSLTDIDLYNEVATIYPFGSVSFDHFPAFYISWNIYNTFDGDKTIPLMKTQSDDRESGNWDFDLHQSFDKKGSLPPLVKRVDDKSVVASLLFTNYSFGNLPLGNNLKNIHESNYDSYLTVEKVESQIKAVSTDNDKIKIINQTKEDFGILSIKSFAYNGNDYDLEFSYSTADSRVYEVLIKEADFIVSDEIKKEIEPIIAFLENDIKISKYPEENGSYYYDSLINAYLALGMKDVAEDFMLKVMSWYDFDLRSAKAEYDEVTNARKNGIDVGRGTYDNLYADYLVIQNSNSMYKLFDYDKFLLEMSWIVEFDKDLEFSNRAYNYLKDTQVGYYFKNIIDNNSSKDSEVGKVNTDINKDSKYDTYVDNGIYTAYTKFEPKPLSGSGSFDDPYVFEKDFNVKILLPNYDQMINSSDFETLDCDYGRNVWGLDVDVVKTSEGYFINKTLNPQNAIQSYTVGAQIWGKESKYFTEFCGFTYTLKKEQQQNQNYSIELKVLDQDYYKGIIYHDDVRVLIKLNPSYEAYKSAGKCLFLNVYWMGVHDQIDLMEYVDGGKGDWYGEVYNPTYSKELGGIILTVDDYVDYIGVNDVRLDFTLRK